MRFGAFDDYQKLIAHSLGQHGIPTKPSAAGTPARFPSLRVKILTATGQTYFASCGPSGSTQPGGVGVYIEVAVDQELEIPSQRQMKTEGTTWRAYDSAASPVASAAAIRDLREKVLSRFEAECAQQDANGEQVLTVLPVQPLMDIIDSIAPVAPR